MRCLAVCQDELVIRMLDEVLLPSFEVDVQRRWPSVELVVVPAKVQAFIGFLQESTATARLAAENAAIQRGIHPRDWTFSNIKVMKEQFRRWGILYDWTKEGRSKLYGHWGRFYESIPMDINERSFGGEVTHERLWDAGSQCGPGVDATETSNSGLRNSWIWIQWSARVP